MTLLNYKKNPSLRDKVNSLTSKEAARIAEEESKKLEIIEEAPKVEIKKARKKKNEHK